MRGQIYLHLQTMNGGRGALSVQWHPNVAFHHMQNKINRSHRSFSCALINNNNQHIATNSQKQRLYWYAVCRNCNTGRKYPPVRHSEIQENNKGKYWYELVNHQLLSQKLNSSNKDAAERKMINFQLTRTRASIQQTISKCHPRQ